MEAVRDDLRAQRGHVVGKPGVERRHQPLRCDPALEGKAHHLALGVGARVGASGGVDHVVVAGELAQRALHLRLHRAAFRLLLPAGETAPVVLEHDFDIHF